MAPKVYAGEVKNGDHSRVKGLKNELTYSELFTLLEKDNKLRIDQEKWFKSLREGNIRIKKVFIP